MGNTYNVDVGARYGLARLSGWRVVHAEVVEIGDVERLIKEAAPATESVIRVAPIAIEIGAFMACAERGSAARMGKIRE